MKHLRDEKALKLIGKRIKEMRQKQELSQSQLAFEAGIPRRQIGRIEKGEVNTGISTLLAISRALDIHLKDLIPF